MPARHREILAADGETSLTFTRHPDGCLLLYPEAAWSRKRSELARLPFSARALQRLVLGSAETVSFDAAGRLLVPTSLRKLAGLKRDVVLLGLGEHFELWDRARWQQAEEDALSAGACATDFVF